MDDSVVNGEDRNIQIAADDSMSWREFLELVPPGKEQRISDFIISGRRDGSPLLDLPAVHLHCDDSACGGMRWYEPQPEILRNFGEENYFLSYLCRNCRRSQKIYAIWTASNLKELHFGRARKYGEAPAFGPPLSPRVQRLVQPDRELFLKGRRCELQGLGVGAFVYYRRVVEENKNRIIDEIRRVAERVGSNEELIAQLDAARAEVQFSKAVHSVKAILPPALLINGSNPLMLLHNALSKGVHELSDDDCLELATSVRIVLTEFAERAGQAIKEDVELKQAVARLQQS